MSDVQQYDQPEGDDNTDTVDQSPDTQYDRAEVADTADTQDTTREKNVPYDRFAAVTRENRKLKREREETLSRLEALETRDQTEIERERTLRQRRERENTELASRLERVERHGWLRDAARGAKFDDPDDAIAFVEKDGIPIDDFEAAVDAVKELARRKPRLLRQEQAPAKQVVRDGERVREGRQRVQQEARQRGDDLTPDAADFLTQLRSATQQAGWQSVPFND